MWWRKEEKGWRFKYSWDWCYHLRSPYKRCSVIEVRSCSLKSFSQYFQLQEHTAYYTLQMAAHQDICPLVLATSLRCFRSYLLDLHLFHLQIADCWFGKWGWSQYILKGLWRDFWHTFNHFLGLLPLLRDKSMEKERLQELLTWFLELYRRNSTYSHLNLCDLGLLYSLFRRRTKWKKHQYYVNIARSSKFWHVGQNLLLLTHIQKYWILCQHAYKSHQKVRHILLPAYFDHPCLRLFLLHNIL